MKFLHGVCAVLENGCLPGWSDADVCQHDGAAASSGSGLQRLAGGGPAL